MSKFDGLMSARGNRSSAKKGARPAEAAATNTATTLRVRSGKRSDPNYRQITAYVRRDVHDEVMQTIYRRMELSELVDELLADWLKKQK